MDPSVNGLRAASVQTPPSFSAVVRDALYCTTNEVLLRSAWELVSESYEPWGADGPQTKFRSPFDAELCHVEPEEESISGYSTSFRSIRHTYYHALVDNVPRMSMLHHPKYASLENIDVIVQGGLTPIEEYYVERMLPGNCTIRIVNPNAIYCVENFILLSHLTYSSAGVLHPGYVEWFRERIQPSQPSDRTRRIFVSRKNARRGRRVQNRPQLEGLLAKYGFETHYVEHYTTQEQVDLFHEAEVVLGAHGAGLTNLLFAKPGTDVVELSPTPYITPHYYYLCRSLGHRYHYLLGQEPHFNNNFVVDLEALEVILEQIHSGNRDLRS
jgi:hypothetical protein